ncbi:hypothetical protein RSAG8_10143, partial [Rhizoctonia solani AG-8 WAC10335]
MYSSRNLKATTSVTAETKPSSLPDLCQGSGRTPSSTFEDLGSSCSSLPVLVL